MKTFEENVISRLRLLEREVERLRVGDKAIGGGGGVTDHGALTGLADDDHTQYLNNTRHDTTTRHTLGTVVPHDDHGALSGLSDNDHPQYLLTTAKAADADKLDGIDSTGFVNTSGAQTVAGIKTFSSIPVLPASNPTTANEAVRKGFADATYLGITAKAADSNLLDGIDSSAFGRPVFLTSPKTSTSWDGDARSTTGKTLIDLSVVFGVPALIKAILVRLTAKDSGSSTGFCQLALSPNNTADSVSVQAYLQGVANNVFVTENGIVPCDANGDVYYQIAASGTNTLSAYIEIWGWWL